MAFKWPRCCVYTWPFKLRILYQLPLFGHFTAFLYVFFCIFSFNIVSNKISFGNSSAQRARGSVAICSKHLVDVFVLIFGHVRVTVVKNLIVSSPFKCFGLCKHGQSKEKNLCKTFELSNGQRESSVRAEKKNGTAFGDQPLCHGHAVVPHSPQHHATPRYPASQHLTSFLISRKDNLFSIKNKKQK